MRGGYDLTGRYYPNAEDALNAEMAQVAEIDARYARQQAEKIQEQIYNNDQIMSQYLEDMNRRLRYLEEPYLYYRDIHIQHEQEQLKTQ